MYNNETGSGEWTLHLVDDDCRKITIKMDTPPGCLNYNGKRWHMVNCFESMKVAMYNENH